MTKFSHFIVFIVLTWITVAYSIPTYVISAPRRLRPLSSYHVAISVDNSPDPVNVNVNVSGVDGKFQAVGETSVKSGETKSIELKIGDWENGNYEFQVEGTGGINFRRKRMLEFNSKKNSLFIQTDKAIYQPGQKVQFRVFAIDSELKPISSNNKTAIYITDAQGNRIKQWENVPFEKGVFQGEIQLSDQPVLGGWTISSKLNDNEVSKSFSVEEYVLPKYEVTVTPPSFATYNDTNVPVRVEAKYTYGKPVKGTVVLAVRDSCNRYGYNPECAIRPNITATLKNGEAVIPLNVEDIKYPYHYYYSQNTVDLNAEVTEDLTNKTMLATGSLTIYPNREKLTMTASPEQFRPELPLKITLTLTEQDNKPVTNADVPVNVSIGFGDGFPRNYSSFKFPKSGIIEFDIFPTLDSENVQLEANYKSQNAYLSVSKAQSLSTKYLMLDVQNKAVKVGDEVEVLVNSTFPLSQITYQVVSRGDVLEAKTVPVDDNSSRFKLPIHITQKMSPSSRLIVYVVTACGELIVDSIDFAVDGFFSTPVELTTSINSTKPGSPVEISVDTKPNSWVGLLAIDQSVLLLKSGNDITQDDVSNDFKNGYDVGGRPNWGRSKRSLIWRPPAQGVSQIFNDAGLAFFSNGLFQKESSYSVGYTMFKGGIGGSNVGYALPAPAQAPPPPPPSSIEALRFDQSQLTLAPKLRKSFPETWIWNSIMADEDGKSILKTVAPDTITSWVLSAIAMNDESGIGIVDHTSKVNVFRPFFVSLNLPYSVVRGEKLNLQALVFNYMKEDMEANVTLSNDHEDFELLEEPGAKSLSKQVTVPANDAASVHFQIRPKKVGHSKVKITAIGDKAGDAVQRELLVKAEGTPRYVNKAVLVDLRNKTEFKSHVNIEIPKDAVKDSERVEISAIGDIMGPTVKNLGNLLRVPYGCGEQNMVNFVPNIVVAKYLEKAGRISSDIKDKAIKNMESGYQRELTYKRNDGSFSAFGQSDKEGSTWLTAFVVKSFHQAEPYITISPDVKASSLQFLAGRLAENGTFVELGQVFNKALQGGSSDGVGLTAYVLIAFLTVKDDTYKDVVKNVTEYLESKIDDTNDPYDLAIVTYALNLANSPQKDKAFNKLNEKAERKGDIVRWKRDDKPTNKTNPYWSYDTSKSQNIEATSYGLLTHVERNLISESIPIMKWLVSQRNEMGGFASTQDTVIGLEALGNMAGFVTGGNNSKVDIEYKYNGRNKRMTVEDANSLVLQSEILPNDVRELNISAVGKGMAIVQVTWVYNVLKVPPSSDFTIVPKVLRLAKDSFDLQVCVSYKSDNDTNSNMAIVEINLPSGYTADKESLPSGIEDLKRIDVINGDTTLQLYFNKLNSTKVCPKVVAVQTFDVSDLKNTTVSVYDYYENDKKATAFYHLKN